jgi:hypothetical protein
VSVSYPDRWATVAAQEAWAVSQVAPEYGGEQGLPTHADEIMASHEGRPTVATQDRVNGAGLPAVDDGPDPGSVVG